MSPPKDPFKRRAARGEQVARLVAFGLLNKEIAWQLGLNEGTVKTYLKDMMTHTNVLNRTALAAWYILNVENIDEFRKEWFAANGKARPPAEHHDVDAGNSAAQPDARSNEGRAEPTHT